MEKRRASDDRIVALYLARDERALELTREQYGKLAFSLCFSVLGSREDAEECVNDLLLALWRRIPPEQPENFRAYLCKAARAKALDRLESARRQKRVPQALTERLDDLADRLCTDDVERQIEDRELSALIDRFLVGLKKEARLIFVYRFFFWKPAKEIAIIVGKSERAVFQSLEKTKEKLKKYLENEGYPL